MAGNNKKRTALVIRDSPNSSPVRPTKIGRADESTTSTQSSFSSFLSTLSSNFQSLIGSSQANPIVLGDSAPNQLQIGSSQGNATQSDEWVEEGIDTDPTQQFQNNDFQLYGNLPTKIVGVRYYTGYVSPQEMVLIRREPHNQYDSNAIQVLNVRSEQIGHIPRQIALKLAPFMDSGKLLVEGKSTGVMGGYDCPIELLLYGSSDQTIRSSIKEEMKEAKLPTSQIIKHEREEKARFKEEERLRKEREKQIKAAKKAGIFPNFENSHWSGTVGNGEMPSLADIINESQKFNPRSFDEMAEKFGLPEGQLEDMPMAKQPVAIKSQLLPYQRQGLAWLLEKEIPRVPAVGSKECVQLWKRSEHKSNMFTNIATQFSTNSEPQLASGGILADDMGLGKTIQVISLIMASRESRSQDPAYAPTTLIVAPLSVMSNWTLQIERHVKEEHGLKVLVYHGSNKRLFNANQCKEWDVVVTTYDTIRAEHFGKNAKQSAISGLQAVKWRRIVLDEAHTIRNPAAKTTTAINALKAQSRWALTGTPIVNTLKDLYSLVRFLGLSGGVEKWELFNGAIIRPLNAGVASAGEILQLLMNSICLRRKKEMKFIDLKLPELSEYIHRIDFHPHEQEQYDALQAQAKGTLEEYQQSRNKKGANSSTAYRHLLETLLRLRQFCNHWQLVGQDRIKSVAGEDGVCLELTPENKKMLEKMLQLHVESQEDCPVCIDTSKDPVITLCTHTFCYDCIEKVIDTQHKCPMCRAPLEDASKLLRLPEEDESDKKGLEFTEVSSKLEALLSILKASQTGEGNKTVVFSQWTSFLDVVQQQLVKSDIKFVRIDGTMSAPMRDASMEALEKDPSVTVLLASLGVCSVGLNLVAANQVILADSWWAPAIEDQAVDRVHRLGQTRPTKVFRLVMSNSIEDNVLEIQKTKRKLMMLAFAEKKAKRGNEQGARLADIQTLLGGKPSV